MAAGTPIPTLVYERGDKTPRTPAPHDMAGESESDDFNSARAELFEALGHPVRIQILQALTNGPLSFSKLKNAVGIESSGHLAFHLGKLKPLVKVDADGNYELAQDGREALRLASVAMQASPEGGRPTIKSGKVWRGRRIGGRWLVASLCVGLIIGSALAVAYEQSFFAGHPSSSVLTSVQLSTTTATTTTTFTPSTSVLGPSDCSVPSAGNTNNTYVTGTVDYPPELLGYVYDQFHHEYGSLSDSPTARDLSGLLSPTYFNSSVLSFDFQFLKNSHFTPYMYGGNPNSSSPWLDYPAQIRIGTEGGMLFILVQTMYIYGSPYGNLSSSTGEDYMFLFMRVNNSTYNFGTGSGIAPGENFSEQFSDLETLDGWYVATSGSWSAASLNASYYAGPPSYNYPEGPGSLNPVNPSPKPLPLEPYNFSWVYSAVLGTPDRPLLTRYLFALNMSAIPDLKKTTGNGDCPDLKLLYSLQSDYPFGIPEDNGSWNNFLGVVDNYPTHSVIAPYDPGSYLNVYVKTHYPLQGMTLNRHDVYLLRNFRFQTNVTSPQILACVYCPVANLSLPYSGYWIISGNVTLKDWSGQEPYLGISYNGNSNAVFDGIGSSGVLYPVPAGVVSVVFEVAGNSQGILIANVTLSYHYWTS
jgi:hypothetical protein